MKNWHMTRKPSQTERERDRDREGGRENGERRTG
jgi:hypothetical protein